MSKKTTILKKTSWLVFGRAISDGLAFLFYVCLARTFGESGIGNYAFAFAVADLFSLGVEFGLRHLVTREIARKPGRAADYFANLLVLQIGLTIMIGLSLYFVSKQIGYTGQIHVLLILAFLGLAIKAIGLSFVAFLEALEAMDKSALLEIISRSTIVGFGFLLILAKAQLEIIMIAHVIGGAVYLGMAIAWVRRDFGPLPFKINPVIIVKAITAGLPFAGASALYVLYSRADIMMLRHFIGEAATGAYAVAFRCIETPLVLAFLVGVATYPTLSRASEENAEEERSLFLSTLKWLAILGMMGAATLISVGDHLITYIFGQRFSDSAELIRWMGILFFLGNIKVPYWRLLFARNLEGVQVMIQAGSVALNLVLNLIFIPRWGTYGAAWASIVSEICLLTGLHVTCTRFVFAGYSRLGGRILLAGSIGTIGGILLRGVLPWVVVMGLTLTTLVLAFVAFQIITVEDQRRFTAGLNAFCAKAVRSSDHSS